jgi:hypothetical protein
MLFRAYRIFKERKDSLKLNSGAETADNTSQA